MYVSSDALLNASEITARAPSRGSSSSRPTLGRDGTRRTREETRWPGQRSRSSGPSAAVAVAAAGGRQDLGKCIYSGARRNGNGRSGRSVAQAPGDGWVDAREIQGIRRETSSGRAKAFTTLSGIETYACVPSPTSLWMSIVP